MIAPALPLPIEVPPDDSGISNETADLIAALLLEFAETQDGDTLDQAITAASEGQR